MELILITILVLFNALEDSFRDTNKKVLAHLFNALHIVGWIYAITFDLTAIFIIQYILIRFALFDITYNLIKGNKLFYIGNTSIYDKFLNWFGKLTKFPMNHFLFWIRLISLLIALSFLTY